MSKRQRRHFATMGDALPELQTKMVDLLEAKIKKQCMDAFKSAGGGIVGVDPGIREPGAFIPYSVGYMKSSKPNEQNLKDEQPDEVVRKAVDNLAALYNVPAHMLMGRADPQYNPPKNDAERKERWDKMARESIARGRAQSIMYDADEVEVEVEFGGKPIKNVPFVDLEIKIAPPPRHRPDTTRAQGIPNGISFIPFTFTLESVDLLTPRNWRYGGRPQHHMHFTDADARVGHIAVGFKCTDTRNGRELALTYNHTEFMPIPRDEQEAIAQETRKAIRLAMDHELDESLFNRGEHVKDPHPENPQYGVELCKAVGS